MASNITLYTDFRARAQPGPFMCEWRQRGNTAPEQCCQGFDSYDAALEFANAKIRYEQEVRNLVPPFLRGHSEEGPGDPAMRALMSLPADAREKALAQLAPEQAAQVRANIEIVAATR